jgi:hypothetical protein
MFMKDSDGYYNVLVWVIDRQYNNTDNREGWDYKVRQKDNAHKEWVGEEYWRAERQLKKAT